MIKNEKSDKKRISCIIPAYNEGKRIVNVLSIVDGHPLIDEIIVINDGSTDNTLNVLKKFKNITLITYDKNKGKSFAVYKGIKKSRNDLLMLLDADLLGLTKKDITNLALPIFQNKADISISLRKNAFIGFRLIGIDFISGERVFSKKIIKNKEDLAKLKCFGIEVYLNKIVIKNKLRVKIVRWNNIISPFQNKKFGILKGIRGYSSMLVDIIKTIGFFHMICQTFYMLRLRVK